MPQEVTRHIRADVQRELWARSAGRCEFSNCNRLLYKSSLTQEPVNLAEQAHIYSFSQNGPRGWGPFVTNKSALNSIGNLLLVCGDCHETIDKNETKYSAEILKQWKDQHEERVRIVTGICPTKKSHVVLYGGKIGEEVSPLQHDLAVTAMFPDSYPAEERPVNLEMKCEHEDSSRAFWNTEADHLRAAFERQIRPRISEANPNHFSVFARANQPLLILLGALFTDKIPVRVYQLHREPIGWKWESPSDGFAYKTVRPNVVNGNPVLVISLSAKIDHQRISSVLPDASTIWELTIESPHNDFLKSENQLSMFREAARKLLAEIHASHPNAHSLSIFPAMPVACAVELGRIRMPKADLPWKIYDQNNKRNGFIPTIEIGEQP